MTKKYQPGDRCQVVTAHGTWLNATIISTREGHGGALVRVDGWVTDVWAKPSEIRPALRAVPEPDPHSTAYQGEVGDHQPRVTETVAKYGHVAKDDEVREVSITITPEVPRFAFSEVAMPHAGLPDIHELIDDLNSHIEGVRELSDGTSWRTDEGLHHITREYRGAR